MKMIQWTIKLRASGHQETPFRKWKASCTVGDHSHFPGGTSCKESACQCKRQKRYGFDPWVGKIPWRRKWQPTPVFLPGESPWTEEPGVLQSMGLHEVDVTAVTYTRTSLERSFLSRSHQRFPDWIKQVEVHPGVCTSGLCTTHLGLARLSCGCTPQGAQQSPVLSHHVCVLCSLDVLLTPQTKPGRLCRPGDLGFTWASKICFSTNEVRHVH